MRLLMPFMTPLYSVKLTRLQIDKGLTFFFTMTGSSLVSKSFLFFLRGLSSSLGRGVPSRDSKGGRFFGGSSSFLLGISSRSAFLFTADVVVKAVTVAVATIGGSGSSLESRFNRGSFSSEPGRFDAYLNPGPLFCFEAKRLEKKRAQLYFSGSEILRHSQLFNHFMIQTHTEQSPYRCLLSLFFRHGCTLGTPSSLAIHH